MENNTKMKEAMLFRLKLFNNMNFDKMSDFKKYTDNYKKNTNSILTEIGLIFNRKESRDPGFWSPYELNMITDIEKQHLDHMEEIDELIKYLSETGQLVHDM